MQSRKNCHKRIWLLSGTGDGPPIARALVKKGWRVSVSVVSVQASFAYEGVPLENLWVGSLDGVNGIVGVLKNAEICDQKFQWVLDATHPFATLISANLEEVCRKNHQPLLFFQRFLKTSPSSKIIRSPKELSIQRLRGRRLLLALGKRQLHQAVRSSSNSGASVFARILPTPESLKEASKSGLPDDHLAPLRPLQGASPGAYELALCKRWAITDVVCRQSSGPTQDLWQKICQRNQLRLFLIARPPLSNNLEKVSSVKELIKRVSED